MQQITLYVNGTPVVHHPIAHPPIHIGTHPDNDLVIASNRLRDYRVTIEMDSQGKWFSLRHPNGSDASRKRQVLEPGKRVDIGEYEIALTYPLPPKDSVLPDTFGLIGNSSAIQHLRYEIRRMAPLNGSVLIEGESGTGKELTARAVHFQSKRKEGSFIAVNCGGITETMVEDIFFGHEKGAFTGAGAAHKGAFERAHSGSLFLDEIGELPLSQQASLLRVLDNGQVCRIGSEQSHKVNFRLICATNRDLLQMVAEGEFRLDLYHRVATLQLTTPPLRHRPHDIRLLTRQFLDEFRQEVGPKKLSADAREKLKNHRWDGNCRELKNVLYKAAAMTPSSIIHAENLELSGCPRKPTRLLADECIAAELDKLDGNVSATAKSLGIPRSSLRNRLRRIRQA